MDADDLARCETVEEICLLLVVVQQLGRALENRSHGYVHHHVREFNEILLLARRKLELIKAEAPELAQHLTSHEDYLQVRYWPRPD
jgi:hypothetical protein